MATPLISRPNSFTIPPCCIDDRRRCIHHHLVYVLAAGKQLAFIVSLKPSAMIDWLIGAGLDG